MRAPALLAGIRRRYPQQVLAARAGELEQLLARRLAASRRGGRRVRDLQEHPTLRALSLLPRRFIGRPHKPAAATAMELNGHRAYPRRLSQTAADRAPGRSNTLPNGGVSCTQPCPAAGAVERPTRVQPFLLS